MKEKILDAISKQCRYSPSELDSAYNYLCSYDLVLAAVSVADKFNISLQDACSSIDFV